jgi:hypothetical protein
MWILDFVDLGLRVAILGLLFAGFFVGLEPIL